MHPRISSIKSTKFGCTVFWRGILDVLIWHIICQDIFFLPSMLAYPTIRLLDCIICGWGESFPAPPIFQQNKSAHTNIITIIPCYLQRTSCRTPHGYQNPKMLKPHSQAPILLDSKPTD